MKSKTVINLAVCALFFLGLFSLNANAADPAQVIAKVNDEEILQSEIDQILEIFVLPQFQAQNPGQEIPEAQREQIEKNITEQLVTQTLLLQAAAKADITADDAMVTRQMETAKQQRPDIPEEQLREFIAGQLTIQTMIQQEVASKVTVSDEETQQAYTERKEQLKEPEQIQASHILVQVAKDATQEDKDKATAKIAEALEKAKAGEDFAELAKQYSEGPSNEKGGDLGFFPRGAMVKSFEDAAFALEDGQISDIVETQFGYHIIKLTGRKEEREVPFEEVKDQIKQSLVQQKTNSEIMAWIQNLRDNATIEMMNQDTATN